MLKCPYCGSDITDEGDSVELLNDVIVHKKCVKWYKVDQFKSYTYEEAVEIQGKTNEAFIPINIVESDETYTNL